MSMYNLAIAVLVATMYTVQAHSSLLLNTPPVRVLKLRLEEAGSRRSLESTSGTLPASLALEISLEDHHETFDLELMDNVFSADGIDIVNDKGKTSFQPRNVAWVGFLTFRGNVVSMILIQARTNLTTGSRCFLAPLAFISPLYTCISTFSSAKSPN